MVTPNESDRLQAAVWPHVTVLWHGWRNNTPRTSSDEFESFVMPCAKAAHIRQMLPNRTEILYPICLQE